VLSEGDDGREELLVQKAMKRWLQQAASAAFERWQEFYADLIRQRELAHKSAARWKQMALFAAWNQWFSVIDFEAAQRARDEAAQRARDEAVAAALKGDAETQRKRDEYVKLKAEAFGLEEKKTTPPRSSSPQRSPRRSPLRVTKIRSFQRLGIAIQQGRPVPGRSA